MTVIQLIKELNNKDIEDQDEVMAMPGELIIIPKGDTIRKEVKINLRRTIKS